VAKNAIQRLDLIFQLIEARLAHNCSRELRYFDADAIPFTLSALRKPGSEALRKTLRSDPEAHFNRPLADWQGIVELRGIGEVAHAELIEPFQRTCSPLSLYHQLYSEFLRVHVVMIAYGVRPRDNPSQEWAFPRRRGDVALKVTYCVFTNLHTATLGQRNCPVLAQVSVLASLAWRVVVKEAFHEKNGVDSRSPFRLAQP